MVCSCDGFHCQIPLITFNLDDRTNHLSFESNTKYKMMWFSVELSFKFILLFQTSQIRYDFIHRKLCIFVKCQKIAILTELWSQMRSNFSMALINISTCLLSNTVLSLKY